MLRAVDEDVPRLDVAVDETLARAQRRARPRPGRRSSAPAPRERLRCGAAPQVAALDEAHREIQLDRPARRPRRRQHLAVVDRRREPRLAQEPLAEAGDPPPARARSASARPAGRARARSRGRRRPSRRGRSPLDAVAGERRSGLDRHSPPFPRAYRPGEAGARFGGREPARPQPAPDEDGRRRRRRAELAPDPSEPLGSPSLGEPDDEQPRALGERRNALPSRVGEQRLRRRRRRCAGRSARRPRAGGWRPASARASAAPIRRSGRRWRVASQAPSSSAAQSCSTAPNGTTIGPSRSRRRPSTTAATSHVASSKTSA